MSIRTKLAGALMALFFLSSTAMAAEVEHSTVGIQGYDAVAYFTDSKPVKGDGNHVVAHDGVNYLFASDEHKKLFEANPEKYLPQYNGWCAYGVAVNKKFIADPTVWKIVDGKLYMNLDRTIYAKWILDVPGNIKKADANWTQIHDKAPSDL